MGTASFDVSKYGKNRGAGAGTVISSDLNTSGAFTTSTSAANLEDAGGDVVISSGQVLYIHADVAMRVVIGGTATATTGLYIPAGASRDIEAHTGGFISIIDVA